MCEVLAPHTVLAMFAHLGKCHQNGVTALLDPAAAFAGLCQAVGVEVGAGLQPRSGHDPRLRPALANHLGSGNVALACAAAGQIELAHHDHGIVDRRSGPGGGQHGNGRPGHGIETHTVPKGLCALSQKYISLQCPDKADTCISQWRQIPPR
jgi:hypothetical protein